MVREIALRDEWDALISSFSIDSSRQSYDWGELKASHGWIPRRIAVLNGARCLAAISVLEKRLPVVGGSLLYASGGPLIADIDRGDVWQALLAGVGNVAAQTGAVLLRVDPKVPHEDQAFRRALLTRGFRHLPDDWTEWNNPRVIMALDVRPSEQELKKGLHKRVGQYLGRLARGGGRVTPEASREGMARFHRLLTGLGERKRIPVRGLEYFEELRRRYVSTGQGCLLVATGGGADLGGLLVVRFGKWAYLLYACVDTDSEAARTLHPGPALYWEMIRWARANGCETLELGGSGTNYPPRESDPGFGVYRFKQAFNASLVYLTGYYDYVFRPASYRAFRLVEGMLLPLASRLHATVMGPLGRTLRRPARNGRATPAQAAPRLRILFLGNSHNELSLSCLLALAASGHEIVVGAYEVTSGGVVSTLKEIARARGVSFVLRKGLQRAWGRLRVALRSLGLRTTRFASRAEIVLAYGLPTLPCANPNDQEFVARVRDLGVDLIVVAGFDRILKVDIIKAPPLGCINVHPSLLPRYRGPDPYYWVLANHETTTGVTIHYIDAGIDSGNMITQRELPIAPDETEATLRLKAAAVAADLLGEVLPSIAGGTASSIPQDESKASYHSFRPKRPSAAKRG